MSLILGLSLIYGLNLIYIGLKLNIGCSIIFVPTFSLTEANNGGGMVVVVGGGDLVLAYSIYASC